MSICLYAPIYSQSLVSFGHYLSLTIFELLVFALFYKQNVLLSSDRQGQKIFHEKYECKVKSVFC